MKPNLPTDPSKLLFLDIDGVLAIPATRYEWFHPKCVAYLYEILKAVPCSVVVSSSWRQGRSLVQLQQILRDGADNDYRKRKIFQENQWLVQALIGKTPNLENRGIEILTFMDHYTKSTGTEIRSFVVLDDNIHDLDPIYNHVVQTDYSCGLHRSDVDKAVQILATDI